MLEKITGAFAGGAQYRPIDEDASDSHVAILASDTTHNRPGHSFKSKRRLYYFLAAAAFLLFALYSLHSANAPISEDAASQQDTVALKDSQAQDVAAAPHDDTVSKHETPTPNDSTTQDNRIAQDRPTVEDVSPQDTTEDTSIEEYAPIGGPILSRPAWPALKQQFRSGRKAIVWGTGDGLQPWWEGAMPEDWEIANYAFDNPYANLSVPVNKGREAMVYLSYIVDHYNDLPDYIVFSHGEYRSWHQPEPLPYILKALNLTAVDEHGYVNLRCALEPSCTPETTWVRSHKPYSWWARDVRALHNYIYRPADPWYDATQPTIEGIKIPNLWASPCCAQFAVSRAAILAQPQEYWERVRGPLMEKDLSWAPEFGPEEAELADSWHLGVGYERIWHYLFGQESVTCPSEEYCKKVIYQDRIHCDRQTTDWEHSRDYDSIKCELIE